MKTIRNKGLKRLFAHDDPGGVNSEHIAKLRHILATLNVAHMDLPSFRLHPLTKGKQKGFWAVTVRALTGGSYFRFDGDAQDVDYVDYQ